MVVGAAHGNLPLGSRGCVLGFSDLGEGTGDATADRQDSIGK
jgi:hypothetical protein